MSNPSIKKHMITNFSVLSNLEELGGDKKVILLTSTGLISGNVMMPNSDNPAKKLLADLTSGFASDYKSKYPSNEQDPFDGYVTLEDAVIHSHTGDTNCIPYLMVFIDQIIGVTIGEVQ
ncbi:MAG: hypothetical protein K0R34_2471 [Herbinix sp.]|nr:hypothetical protein [Herbinix sp.]